MDILDGFLSSLALRETARQSRDFRNVVARFISLDNNVQLHLEKFSESFSR